MLSGTAFSQALVFVLSPWLSRVFSASEFGDLANYNAWVAMLALVSSLRYDHAILTAKGSAGINRAIALTSALTITGCAIYSALVLVLQMLPPAGGYLQDIRGILWFIPVGVLFACLTSVFVQHCYRTGAFRRVVAVTIAQTVVTVFSQISLGVLGLRHALIIGTVLGFVFSGLVLGWRFTRTVDLTDLGKAFAFRRLRATAREFISLPRYALGADAISIVVQQFAPVFVVALYSPLAAGLYAFSIRVARAPVLILSGAIAGALRKEVADAVQRGASLAGLFGRTVKTLSVLGIAPFLAFLLYGQELFRMVFGESWIDAGRLVQILSPGIFLEFVSAPLSVFFLVTNSQKHTLRIQLAGFVGLVGALWFGRHHLDDFMTTCYLVSAVMVAMNATYISLAARVTGTTSTPVVAGAEG